MSSRIQERVPLTKLEFITETISPIKRKVKIFSNKLPQDFFSPNYAPITKRNQIHTQDISRKMPSLERLSETRDLPMRVGNLSLCWKEQEDKTMELIKGVIKTSREMKKIIRKHSLQLKKENSEVQSYKIQLPRIINKKTAPYPL